MRFVLASASLVGLLWASPARAQIRDGVGVTLEATGGGTSLRGYPVHPAWLSRAPDALPGSVQLYEDRGSFGGALRFLISSSQVRYGLEMGLAGLPAPSRSLPASQGFSARSKQHLMLSTGLSLGRQLRWGPALPYAEVRASHHLITSLILLRSSDGLMSATPYQVNAFGLGPRLGVWFPAGRLMHVDLSSYLGLWGPEWLVVHLGVGVLLPWGMR